MLKIRPFLDVTVSDTRRLDLSACPLSLSLVSFSLSLSLFLVFALRVEDLAPLRRDPFTCACPLSLSFSGFDACSFKMLPFAGWTLSTIVDQTDSLGKV